MINTAIFVHKSFKYALFFVGVFFIAGLFLFQIASPAHAQSCQPGGPGGGPLQIFTATDSPDPVTAGNDVTITVQGEASSGDSECDIDEVCMLVIDELASSVTIDVLTGPFQGQSFAATVSGGSTGSCPVSGTATIGDRPEFSGSRAFDTTGLSGQYTFTLRATDNRGFSDNKVLTINVTPVNRTLTVNSSGASGVAITGSPWNGTTNYQKTGLADGTNVSITAPATSGAKDFSSWSGCSSTSGTGGRTCNRTMDANRTVTATYVTATTQCSDGIDNDGDGDIDLDDGGCSDAGDDDESGGSCTFTTDLKVNGSDGPVNADVGESLSYDIDTANASNCTGNWRKRIDFDGNGSWDYDNTNSSDGAVVSHTFSSEDMYVSVGRIDNVNSGVNDSDTVTVNVSEPASVVCSPSSQTIDEDTSTNFSASGGTGSFSWSVNPADSVPSSAGNVANFNNVLFPEPGAHTVTVTRGATNDMCIVTVNDLCEGGGTITVNSEDGSGTPLPTTWTLTGPDGDTTPGAPTASWGPTNMPVINPSSTYTLVADPLTGYSTPVLQALPLNCGGDIVFTLVYNVDTTPSLEVSEDVIISEGETHGFTACYDDDGGGPNACVDVTDNANTTWSNVPNTYANPTGTKGEYLGIQSGGSETVTATFSTGLCSGACPSDNARLTVVAESLGVDLKINGSDSPADVNSGDDATITWTTTGSPSACTASGGQVSGEWISMNPLNENGGGSADNLPNRTEGELYTIACEPSGLSSEKDVTDSVFLGIAGGGGEQQCDNGIDDDGDGDIDCDDTACRVNHDPNEACVPTNTDESDDTQCSDGLDNDGDGLIDHEDVTPGGETADDGCENPADDDERGKPNVEEF